MSHNYGKLDIETSSYEGNCKCEQLQDFEVISFQFIVAWHKNCWKVLKSSVFSLSLPATRTAARS